MPLHKLVIRGDANGVGTVLLDGQRLTCTSVQFAACAEDEPAIPRVTLTLLVSDLEVDADVVTEGAGG